MKKFLLILILLCLPFNSLAGNAVVTPEDVAKAEQTGNFTITSDTRYFNPITGVYDLNGHVYVNFPTHGEQLIIYADTAKVKLYKQEVTANGNITLNFGDIMFNCDKVFAKIKERTVYVDGNIFFKHADSVIRADNATYCWKTKLAVFKNASLNGSSKKGILTYDVLNKRFLQ